MTPRSSGHLRAKKGFGQHFLTNRRVASRIVEAVRAGPEDLVIEIGPGKGALTGLLLQKSSPIIGVEVDRDLCEVLSTRFRSDPGFHLLNADAMRLDLEALVRRHGALGALVVGNLPYNVATPLILRFLESPSLRRAVVMVQREVAQRIVAGPGDGSYGSLSIAVQVAASPRRLFDVRRESFRPVPAVESTVLDIDARSPASPVPEAVKPTFTRVVRWTFGHRRKMLRATLRTLPGSRLDASDLEAFEVRCNLDLRRRPETLSVGEFERLAWAVQEAGQTDGGGAGTTHPPLYASPDEGGG